MTNSIFGQAAPVTGEASIPAADQQQEEKPTAESLLLSQIVDETGRPKYNTVEAALQGLQHANNYIGQLHGTVDSKDAELNALREDLASRKSVAELSDALHQHSPQQAAVPQPVTPPASEGLSAAAAAELFQSLLTKNQQDVVRGTNERAVTAALKEKYGDKAEEMYMLRANELGMKIDDLNSLSGTSPSAVLELFGTATTQASVDVSGSINPAALAASARPEAVSRNAGKSVLSGSTSREVRQEYEASKVTTAQVHEAGHLVSDLSDPKKFAAVFGDI